MQKNIETALLRYGKNYLTLKQIKRALGRRPLCLKLDIDKASQGAFDGPCLQNFRYIRPEPCTVCKETFQLLELHRKAVCKLGHTKGWLTKIAVKLMKEEETNV